VPRIPAWRVVHSLDHDRVRVTINIDRDDLEHAHR
jgi:hypothetical protein